jgi:hypothetical protein
MPETITKHYLLAVENLKPRIVSNRPEWYNHVVNLPTQQQAV